MLVGNSTGGLICQLVLQEIPERISHVIWYMAFILDDGESILDACPPEFSDVLPELKRNQYPVPPHDVIREALSRRRGGNHTNVLSEVRWPE